MKNNRIKKILVNLILVFILSSCQQDHDAKESLKNSSFVQSAAKWIGYNLNKNSRFKGVYKYSLLGTQTFDSAVYEWDDDGLDGDNRISILENGGKTITWYNNLTRPWLSSIISGDSWVAFADGTFPDQRAYFSGASPMFTTSWTLDVVDKDGNNYDTNQRKYAIGYDSSTGYPSTMTYTYANSSGTVSYKYIETYASDPFDGSYYRTGINYYSDGTNLSSGYTYSRTRSTSGNKNTDINTNTYFSGSEPDYLSSKSETITVTDSSEKTTTSSEVSYSISSGTATESGRIVHEYSYDNFPLRRISTYSKKTYSVSSGTATLTDREDVEYDNGLWTTWTYYTNNGSSANIIYTSTYDDRRLTKYTGKGVDNNTQFIEWVATYDSSNRRSVVTRYSVSSDGSKNCYTPSGFKKYENSYSTNSTGEKVFTQIYYGSCSGTDVTGTPYKYVFTYNSKGLLTSSKTYTDSDSSSSNTFTLSYQRTYEYDDNGAINKIQTYTVSSGTATAAAYTTYEYDSNLFQTTEKFYNNNLTLTKCNSSSSGICSTWGSECSSGNECYNKYTYTYK